MYEQLLLTELDTTNLQIWTERAKLGKQDSVIAIARALFTLQISTDLADVADCFQTIAEAAKQMPSTYSAESIDIDQLAAGYVDQARTSGCMGPDSVNQTEIDFATETVLAGLVRHHDCVPAERLSKHMLPVWQNSTLPQLKAAVQAVLETRDAWNF